MGQKRSMELRDPHLGPIRNWVWPVLCESGQRKLLCGARGKALWTRMIRLFQRGVPATTVSGCVVPRLAEVGGGHLGDEGPHDGGDGDGAGGDDGDELEEGAEGECDGDGDGDEEAVDEGEEQDINEILAALLAEDLADKGEAPDHAASIVADAGPPAGVVAEAVAVMNDSVPEHGASGSASSRPVPPPQEQPEALAIVAADARGPRLRGKPTAVVEYGGGVMGFYLSNSVFQAKCGNPFHGSCVLSRRNTQAAHMRGRPLGLMAAWLAEGALYDTKEAHWASIDRLVDEQGVRAHHRRHLVASAEGRAVAAYERPTDPPCEPSEGEPE